MSESATTPGRYTEIVLDVAEPVVQRPPWSVLRRGPQLTAGAESTNVVLLPSGSWSLRPYQHLYGYELINAGSGVLRLLMFVASAAISEQKMYRSPGDLMDVTVTGETTDGDPFLVKRIPAGTSWNLAGVGTPMHADTIAHVSPTLETATVPMDRIVISTETFPANQGFGVRFQPTAYQFHAADTLFTLMFGGPADTLPATLSGGQWGVSVLGDGRAQLRERVKPAEDDDTDATQWKKVYDWRYAPMGSVAGRVHQLLLIPEGRQYINLIAASTEHAVAPQGLQRAQQRPTPASPYTSLVTTSRMVNGYDSKKTVTGEGNVRTDQRRDLRFPFQVSKLTYPELGELVDLPFFVSFPMPGATPMQVVAHFEAPTGTDVTVSVRRGDDGTPLTHNPDGTWASVAGLPHYVARFTLSGDGTNTPYLYGYQVYVSGERVERTTTEVFGGLIQSVDVTCADIDPSHEEGRVNIEDPGDELAILRVRARLHAKLTVRTVRADPSTRVTILDGEIAHAPANLRPAIGHQGVGGAGAVIGYPKPDWRLYQTQWISMWSRLADQLSFVVQDFSRDPSGTVDADGNVLPWKFTAIIDWVLDQAGFPADMRDIPDWPQRAWMSGGDAMEFLLQPTTNLLEYVLTIAKDYLGAYLVWDPNAGTRGMMRLMMPPTSAPYNTLWHFVTTSATGTGKQATHPASYPANTTFIDRFTPYIKPPEGNFIIVTASGVIPLPGQTNTPMYTQYAWNPKSFNLPGLTTADESHPDYLGRMVPIILFDPSLATGKDNTAIWNAINLVTRRLYNRAAHAEKWFEFHSPHMPLMTDPADTHLAGKKRPLRIYDAITIDGFDALMRGPSLAWSSRGGGDDFQGINVEAVAASA